MFLNRNCSFVVSLIFCFLSFYDLVDMAITKMIMSVAQSLRNFLMTVKAQVCVESTVQSVVSIFFENSKKTKMTMIHFACEGYCLVLLRVTKAFKRTIAHVRAIVLVEHYIPEPIDHSQIHV